MVLVSPRQISEEFRGGRSKTVYISEKRNQNLRHFAKKLFNQILKLFMTSFIFKFN